MTNTSLLSAVSDALAIGPWSESTNAVKRAVINVLGQMDSRVQIEDTHYFNHSIVPDLVLTWPDSDTAERLLFLRLSKEPDLLADDLLHVGHHRPILLPLDVVSESDELNRID